MTLEKGARLGPYEILSAVGAGGMGEVYLASDTRLNRRVAIKVLTSQWSSNPEMKTRFVREAQIIAGLSHPHICTLHDVGHEGNTDYLVMEYLEGQTLADRIARGGLPVEEAVRIAVEIADALDKAHREGVTHRDLKPGNVMLTRSGVKLLDFGLARQQTPVKADSASHSMLPTRADVTMQGAIVGTMQYMAPEQLEGKDVTPQTDIFAFGAVLYEMLTGKKAFASESQAGLISAIMASAPLPISATQKIDLPALEYAVKTCLEKDPADRWQSCRDLMHHLRWAVLSGAAPAVTNAATPPRKRVAPMAVLVAAAVLPAILITAFAVRRFQDAPPADEIRFVLDWDVAGASYAISPDGRWIAFAGREPGNQQRALYLRSMASTRPQKIPGTEDALAPFWSPDNKRIGFFSGSSLKTVAVSGGVPETLCAAPGTNRTGTWSQADVIVISSNNTLHRVSAAGGKPEPVTSLNISRAETLHIAPFFLPDGKRFLFSVASQQVADMAIAVGSLESKDVTRILPLRSASVYSSGHLLYVDNGTLVARPFDPDGLAFTGEPIRIASQADFMFSVSSTGVLAYREAMPAVQRTWQFSWVDRNGKDIGTVGQPERYLPYWDLSADGKQAAVTRVDPQTSNVDVWAVDLERGISSRVTTDPAVQADPHWSPDGLRIAYITQQRGNRDVSEKSASGLGEETQLLHSPEPETIDDLSPDGKYVIYRTGANTNTIHALPLFGERKPFAVVESEFNKDGSHLSPNSKWLAYNANESGMSQIYVVSFPKPDQKRQISTLGGTQPQWRGDGKELFYLDYDGKMMAVDIVTEPTLSSGTPRQLFDTGIGGASFDAADYGVTADGKRFLLLKALPVQQNAAPSAPPVTVILNWTAALKERNSK